MITKGYKATDKDIRCRGYQFVPGEWHEISGELELCGNAFHFCPHPSGVWAYYPDPDTRVWEVDAEDVLATPPEPGADAKLGCRRIRLVREITPGLGADGANGTDTGDRNTSDRNTGYRNTGYGNTGDCNTGYGNTGYGNTSDRNTGYRNTGYGNTGDCNTGYGNTGYGNTGDCNTGYGNTGHRNTGHRNTGDRNTGDRNTGSGNTGSGNTGDGNTGSGNTGDGNTGHRNTGYGNATNFSTGFFCAALPLVVSFDSPTNLTAGEYRQAYPEYWNLCLALGGDKEIPFARFARLPGITPQKLKALHDKHKAGRAAAAARKGGAS